MLIGNTNTTGQGFVYQSGGNFTGSSQLELGATGTSYGYYNLSGGSITTNELDLGWSNGSVGVLDMSGGTLNATSWLLPARGGGSTGVLNMTGGTINMTGGSFAENLFSTGATQSAVINIGGNATINALNATFDLMQSGVAGQLGVLNLLPGGVMKVQGVTASNATGTSLLNFNGGTLKANGNNAGFLSTNITAVNVYSGNGTIDNNGIAITIPNALVAPAGSGGNSNPTVSSGGSGYLAHRRSRSPIRGAQAWGLQPMPPSPEAS